ncbi:MAG: TRAP transporter substrate-binding protein [Spirochaetales bacterium]|jgi:tripartite ATP-independent transporter DctP family solute receptor|nr:TRAP transporter substrate-binding protein [Spirochaetales bacterium]
MMKRKIVCSLLCFLLAGAVFAGGKSEGGADKAYNLKFSNFVSAQHAIGVAIDRFCSTVTEKSAGKAKVTAYHNSELGSLRESTENVQMGGTIDFVINSHGALAVFQPSKRFAMFELYYVWKDVEDGLKFMNGPEGRKECDQYLEETGMLVLTNVYQGTRHVTNSIRPVKIPADMKGLRLRVPEAESSLEGIKAMSGTPISMSFSELYSAMQQKVVDGQENPLAQINDSKFFEVQNYLSRTAHSIQYGGFVTNNEKFTGMGADLQKVIQDEANACMRYMSDGLMKAEEDLAKSLAPKIAFNEVDKAAFMTAAAPMLDQFAKKIGPEAVALLGKIQAAQK